ncbi:MAG: hypothetical protein JW837_15865 [Sedimentisphaerales bacterium]|nr:hypothetical protein [Sedimentisphaerales bacterium]
MSVINIRWYSNTSFNVIQLLLGQTPIVDSELCKIRITNTANPGVYDTNDEIFSIYECLLDGDMNGDCIVDFSDLAIMASNWLQNANPYVPGE